MRKEFSNRREQAKAVRRFSQSTSRQVVLRLGQIVTDDAATLCHRQPEALAEKRLQPLAESLVQEGQQVPISVAATGSTTEIGGEVLPTFLLVGGNRRDLAILQAVEKNLDPGHFHADMEVGAVEIMQGERQSDEDFQRDLLVRSVSDNEQRLAFSIAEKLGIVQRFREARVPAPRAASALSFSEPQYRRFLLIIDQPWLHALVVDDAIGTTDAAELIAEAEKAGQTELLRRELTAWVEARRLDLRGRPRNWPRSTASSRVPPRRSNGS